MTTTYIRPSVSIVKLHDMMQVTTISGVANEDSMGRRFETETNPDNWNVESTTNDKTSDW